jgi:ribonuclease P protein component
VKVITRVTQPGPPGGVHGFDKRFVTRSNVRLFGKHRQRPAPQFVARAGLRKPVFRATQAARGSITHEVRNETHLPAIENPSCANARISRTHENRRRPQGAVGPPCQGPCPACRLTHVPAPAPRGRAARYRLRSAAAFETVFKAGARHDGRFLQLIATPAAQSPGRVGYVIGRKVMRRAVDRNRLRRCLREIVRAARPAVLAFDVVLRVKRIVLRADIPLASAESRHLLERLVSPR